MHVVLGLLIAGIVIYLAFRFLGAQGQGASSVQTGAPSQRGFAFLSNGLLFCREPGGTVQQVHSAYAQESQNRKERSREKHSWKEGTAFEFRASGRMRGGAVSDKPVQATSAVYEPDGSLLYFLKDEGVGGLFRRNTEGREERIVLRQNLVLGDLALAPGGGRLAASTQQSAGISNIALMQTDGNGYREVTGGDTIDSAPAWIPGVPNRLLFQSCGLARDEHGFIVAQSNASIQKLDMETGSVSPILDDPRFDFLKPRVCPAGNLHFIRRPYEAPQYGMKNIVLDTLLFPFRLLRAVFHFLNFFSLMYTRKPLTSAQGPSVQADLKNILLQGRRIDAERALRSGSMVQGVPSLVPASWELVRRDANGRETVLATSVASYDLGPDGTVVYSNGRGVFELTADGASRVAARDELVSDLVAAAV